MIRDLLVRIRRCGARVVSPVLVFMIAIAPVSAAQDSARTPSQQQPVITAADSALNERVRSLSAQLRCPVCQGLALQDSPSELAQQMRDVVRAQIELGKSDDEVKAYFVGRYGEWILMEPTARGFNMLVYILPFVGLAAGGAFLVFVVRRWTGAPATEQDSLQDDEFEDEAQTAREREKV